MFSYLIVSVLWVNSVPTVMLVVEDGDWMGWDACRWYASSVVLKRKHFLSVVSAQTVIVLMLDNLTFSK